MTKPIEDSTNAAAIRAALDVPTTADLSAVDDAAQAAAAEAAAKYTKPSTGIPASDLAAAAQTSLGKADSAIQDLAGMTAKFNAGTAPDKAAFQSSLSGYMRTSGVWASRPVSGAIGDEYLATDIGTAGVLFRWSAPLNMWRLAHDQIIAFRDAAVVGVSGGGAQILAQLAIPAGLLQSCGRISLQNSFSKSGATDAATNITVRLGATGTTSDAVIVSVANPMTAANRSWPAETMLRPLSSTSLAPGGAATLTSSFGGSGSGGVYGSVITVPDMSSNALIFSASITMAGSTDTPTSQFVYLQGFAA